MREGRLERYAPLTGVVFVGLVVAAILVTGSTPDTNDKTAKVVHFWMSHKDKETLGALLGGLALIFLLWYLGSLRSALRAAEGGLGRLSAIAYSGGIVLVAGAGMSFSFQFAAADTSKDVPPQVTQTLSVLQNEAFIPLAIGLLVLLFATGILIVRTAALPRWLGWVGIALGIVAFTPVGFIGFLGWLPWTLVISILLYLRQRPPPAAPTGPAASPGSPS